MKKRPVCLVIENDEETRLLITTVLITTVLTGAGFEVNAVASGAQAVAAAASNSVLSLITLEIGLPDMDGYDVARALRSLSTAPLIFLTQRSERDDALAAMAAGAAAYMTKPFSPSELQKTVQRLAPLAQRN